MLFLGDDGHFFLRLKLLRSAVIAAKNGQALVNLKLRLSERSSSHRQLYEGRGSKYQSLLCQLRHKKVIISVEWQFSKKKLEKLEKKIEQKMVDLIYKIG